VAPVPASQACQGSTPTPKPSARRVPPRTSSSPRVPETDCPRLKDTIAKAGTSDSTSRVRPPNGFGRTTPTTTRRFGPDPDHEPRGTAYYHYLASIGRRPSMDFTNPKAPRPRAAAWSGSRNSACASSCPAARSAPARRLALRRAGPADQRATDHPWPMLPALKQSLAARRGDRPTGFHGMERIAAAGLIGPSPEDEVWPDGRSAGRCPIHGALARRHERSRQNAVESWPASTRRGSPRSVRSSLPMSPLFISRRSIRPRPVTGPWRNSSPGRNPRPADASVFLLAMTQSRERALDVPARFPRPGPAGLVEVSDQFMLERPDGGPARAAGRRPASPLPAGRWLHLETLELITAAKRRRP